MLVREGRSGSFRFMMEASSCWAGVGTARILPEREEQGGWGETGQPRGRDDRVGEPEP